MTESKVIPIKEFGGSLSYTNDARTQPIVETALNKERLATLKFLDYFKTIKIISDEPFVEGPPVDMLQRFRAAHWKIKVAIDGYDEIAQHFACRKQHQPDKVDWKYVKITIRQWLHDRKTTKEEDSEYN